MVRILIISDIHLWSLPSEHDPFDKMRRELMKDVADYADEKGPIQHILISGDIANTGAKSEYEKATEFIKELCRKCKCPDHEVYVVPGNHDQNFNEKGSGVRHLIHEGMCSDNIDSDKHWHDMLMHDVESAQILYRPFKDYYSFASSFDSIEPMMAKCLEEANEPFDSKKHKMVMHYKLSNVGEYPINLYGMNTALTSDWYDINDEGKGHKLYLPKLAYNIYVEKEGQINMLMMHHPVDRVKNGIEIKDILDKNFQIQIFGHLHSPVSDSNNAIHILSGAFQPPSEDNDTDYFSVYNILELEIATEAGEDILKTRLLVEKYNKNTFEHLDTECKQFRVKLKKTHQNRWQNKMEEIKDDSLPLGISKRESRFAFLQSPRNVQIMKDFGRYDEQRSNSLNAVSFLNWIDENNKMSDLWNKLRK